MPPAQAKEVQLGSDSGDRRTRRGKRGRHHFFRKLCCPPASVVFKTSAASLQELTGLRARRSLILQHGLCRGIDRLGREYTSWSRTRAAIIALCLGCIGGAGGNATQVGRRCRKVSGQRCRSR